MVFNPTDVELKKPTSSDMDKFVARCIEMGWMVRYRTHLKTKVRWLKKKVRR